MSSTQMQNDAARRPGPWTWLAAVLLFAVPGTIVLVATQAGSAAAIGADRMHEQTSNAAGAHGIAPAARRLADTGLYSDFVARTIADDVLPFTPQYPLWTDGAAKQRWIRLPPGHSIDAADPDAWVFPVGTRLWKEFSFGRRVETRLMELGADGRWIYATYAWAEDESDAVLAPDQGVRGACTTPVGSRHDIPSVADCRACHEGGASAVLGFGALQLSPDRDPLALHAERPARDAVDLDDLIHRGLVRNLPEHFRHTSPRIEAASPRERAVLGYFHGNCGSCHNATGSLAALGLQLDYTLASAEQPAAPAIRTTLEQASRFQMRHDDNVARIEPGAPDRSTLFARVSSRSPVAVMPPLGTRAVDEDALALIRDWITSDLTAPRITARAAPLSNPMPTNDTNEQENHR